MCDDDDGDDGDDDDRVLGVDLIVGLPIQPRDGQHAYVSDRCQMCVTTRVR